MYPNLRARVEPPWMLSTSLLDECDQTQWVSCADGNANYVVTADPNAPQRNVIFELIDEVGNCP